MNVSKAATVGDVQTVNKWLSAPPHTRHPKQVQLVLGRAARYGHDNICQSVLKSGEVTYCDVVTALTTACTYNQLSTAQLLLRCRHINHGDLLEALLGASLYGHKRIIVWLISDVIRMS